MFVMAFSVNQGFPYEVRIERPVMEPLSNEREALDFIDSTSSELISDAWQNLDGLRNGIRLRH